MASDDRPLYKEYCNSLEELALNENILANLKKKYPTNHLIVVNQRKKVERLRREFEEIANQI